MLRATLQAWCSCGHRFAGRPWQIAYAASIHWRTCPAEWRLLLTPPIPLTDKTEMGTR